MLKKTRNNITYFYKVASVSAASSSLAVSIREIRSMVSPETSYEIVKLLSSRRLQDKHFSPSDMERDVKNLFLENEEDVDSLQFFIKDIVNKSSRYNSEYLKTTDAFERSNPSGIAEALLSDPNIRIGKEFENRDQVAFIQGKLEGLGYMLGSYGVDGKFGAETEEAIILFQQENNLSTTGLADAQTLKRLLNNPKPFPIESRREHRRRMRQERRSGPSRGAFVPTEFSNSLTNVSFTSSRVDINGGSAMLKEYLKILNHSASESGANVRITSAARDSYNQSRIMYDNYKRKGVGSTRANSYLARLYRKFPRIEDIINIYKASTKLEVAQAWGRALPGSLPSECQPGPGFETRCTKDIEEMKRLGGAGVVEARWPKVGHLSGNSIDIGFGGKIQGTLIATQHLATVDILRESDHYHVTIKSLSPGGIPPGKIRTFRG